MSEALIVGATPTIRKPSRELPETYLAGVDLGGYTTHATTHELGYRKSVRMRAVNHHEWQC